MPIKTDKIKSYTCDLCSKSYVYQSGLCAHMRTEHVEIALHRKTQKIKIKKKNDQRISPSLEVGNLSQDILSTFIKENQYNLNQDITKIVLEIYQNQISIKDGKVYYLKNNVIESEYLNDQFFEMIYKTTVLTVMDIGYQHIIEKKEQAFNHFSKITDKYLHADEKLMTNVIRSALEKMCTKELKLN